MITKKLLCNSRKPPGYKWSSFNMGSPSCNISVWLCVYTICFTTQTIVFSSGSCTCVGVFLVGICTRASSKIRHTINSDQVKKSNEQITHHQLIIWKLGILGSSRKKKNVGYLVLKLMKIMESQTIRTYISNNFGMYYIQRKCFLN